MGCCTDFRQTWPYAGAKYFLETLMSFLFIILMIAIGLLQTINFFKLGSKLSLVDLPGYGFAYAKEEVKEAWEELVSVQIND